MVRISEEQKYQRRWWTLGVLSLSLVIIGLDNTILNIAIPTLQTELSASASELQWIVDSYILVFAGLLLTMGAIGDRFGRARTLFTGLVLFGLASGYAAFTQSAGELIVARALMGSRRARPSHRNLGGSRWIGHRAGADRRRHPPGELLLGLGFPGQHPNRDHRFGTRVLLRSRQS